MDRQTVQQAQGGDEQAFITLMDAVGDRLRSVAGNLLRDRHLAEDATQQALLTIWHELPKLRDPDRFEAWAYRILVNACRSEGRKSRRWLHNPKPELAEVLPAPDQFSSVLERERLDRAFTELSTDQRIVVVLYHYLDLSAPDIAAMLDIAPATVRSRLHRALQLLRAALEAHARPPGRPSNSPTG